MPYILVRGTFFAGSNDYTTDVIGLKASDIKDLSHFPRGEGFNSEIIRYRKNIPVMLTALEVLGYKVVSCTADNASYYMWTLRKDFSEPEPGSVQQ